MGSMYCMEQHSFEGREKGVGQGPLSHNTLAAQGMQGVGTAAQGVEVASSGNVEASLFTEKTLFCCIILSNAW